MEEPEGKTGVFDVTSDQSATVISAIDVNYEDMCRLCMSIVQTSQDDTLAVTTFFTIYEDVLQYYHLAMALLANLKIDENDCLPKKLCNECRINLIEFYTFKRKCEAINRTLNDIFQTNNIKPELEESHCIEMCTTLIDDNLNGDRQFDDDVAATKPSENCREKDMLESDYGEAATANVEEEQLKCEIKRKKRKRTTKSSKRKDVISSSDAGNPLARRPNAKEKTRKVCEQCGLTFSSNCTLRRHRITHTGQKDFVCDICQNRFARKFHLDMHMRIHLKIRPHICDVCANTFSTSSDLSRHRRIHVDVKNYACVVCERRFKRSSDVIKHMRSHTGQKPYACKACDKKYSSHSGLSKHLRRHHPQLVVQRVNEINEKKAKEQEIIERKKYVFDAMNGGHNENAPLTNSMSVFVP